MHGTHTEACSLAEWGGEGVEDCGGCVLACIRVRVCARLRMCVHVCVYLYSCARMHMLTECVEVEGAAQRRLCACVCACIHVRLLAYAFVRVHTSVCLCLYLCVHVCMCTMCSTSLTRLLACVNARTHQTAGHSPFPFHSLPSAAIRQAVAKAVVAFYQKCECGCVVDAWVWLLLGRHRETHCSNSSWRPKKHAMIAHKLHKPHSNAAPLTHSLLLYVL